MAQKHTAPEAQTENTAVAIRTTQEAATAFSQGRNLEDAFQYLEELPEENFHTITGEVFKWDGLQGVAQNMVVTGFTTMKSQYENGNENGEIPALTVMVKEQGEIVNKIIADAVIVASFKRYEEKGGVYPVAARVTFTGEQKSANGKYRTFSIGLMYADARP
jgi:hypothetical protein